MAIRRYPHDMFDEMDRMFDAMRAGMFPEAFGSIPSDGDVRGAWLTEGHVRVELTDDGHVVVADLPGFEREEIDLRFDDGLLTIEAVHEVSDESHARSRRVSESVSVPGDVVVEDVEATYRNGVLEVHLPVEGETDGEDGHRIDID